MYFSPVFYPLNPSPAQKAEQGVFLPVFDTAKNASNSSGSYVTTRTNSDGSES
jgi:hypothetical protein